MVKGLFQIAIIGLFCLIPFLGGAQELRVDGYFLQDSAKLGERVAYILKASYGKGHNVVFPDSTYDYSPFVLLEKKTYMSTTADGITLDSAVYFMSNFSLEPTQALSLPVYEVFKYDSLEHAPLASNLALKLVIDEIPQELSFQDNNVYQPIDTTFNYPLLAVILLGTLGLVIVVMFFFGSSIKKQWDRWKEKRKYKRFASRWKKAEREFATTPDMEHADELLGLWKTYMEHLNNKPFREWTTLEISEFLQNKEIVKDFREIEMIIYAGKNGVDLPKACENLWNVCSNTFHQKITHTDERK